MQKRKESKKTAAGRRKSKKYTKGKIIALFISAILFSIIVTEIAYFLYKIDYVKVLYAKLEVGNKIGFALGEEKQDIINFGTIPSGSGGKRFLTLENQDKKDLFTQIIVIGDIKKFLNYENNFLLKVNETKKLTFEVFVPENIEKGRFNGRIFIIFKKV